MRIAVAGCGIAGSLAAWQLAEQGHQVTLFEQAPKSGPVGAGILLQPSGQRILQRVGLLETVVDQSARIDSLHAQHRSGSTLVHLPYQHISNDLFGLGVLRSLIFQLLFERCQAAGVDICEGTTVVEYTQSAPKVSPLDSAGRSLGEFDLLVVADGSRSRLRQCSGLTKSIQEYPDAAMWTVGPYSGPQDCLLQIVGRCGRLVGMLPVGNGRCSFFWGLKKSDEPQTRSAGVDSWKRQVADFFPAAEECVADIKSMDEVTYATCRNARMSRMTQGRVVFVGDAAHGTSPHLGQGLNLALEDSMCLAGVIKEQDDWSSALAAYERSRKPTTQFYSHLTGMLTPYFQTSNRILQLGRDAALPLMPRIPWIGSQMVYTMAGLKTGWLTHGFKTRAAS